MGMVEEAKLFQGSSAENNWEFIEEKDQEEDEEFYEKIEAPKFVDFTLPNHYGPDDRYWFCLRVGCDQKHEEEMDSEAIYKKFVLRVMAARSPNVRFYKALHRNASSKTAKCPLSAPPKPSKSVLPRFAIVSSSLSKRIGDDIVKEDKPQAKVYSTPKAKGKQVSSKYLTTPSYKNCPPNPRSFQSVRKPMSPPTLVLPKSRIVAKALNFQSPRKALKLKKKSMEEKLCEGLKNLGITSQKSKRVLGYSSKTSKPIGNNSQKSPTTLSTREKVHKLENSRSKMSSVQPHTQNNHDAKSSRSIKHKNQDKLSKSCNLKESVPNDSCAGNDENLAASESCRDSCIEAAKDSASAAVIELPLTTENIDSLSRHASEADDSPRPPQVSSKEKESTDENEKQYTTVTGGGGAGCESVVTQIDDKENALAFDENNRCVNNISNLTGGIQVLGMHNSEGKKDTPNLNKKKGSAAGMRMMKPKQTNPKPFRLRTDERGILKETYSEKKTHVVVPPQKEVSILSRRKDGDHGDHILQNINTSQDIQKRCTRLAAAKTPEQHMVRKTPTSLTGHSSKLQDVKPVISNHQRKSSRHLKNVLRKSTVSSRMHAMASKMTPVKVVSAGKEIPPERKFNTDRNKKSLVV